MYNSKIKLKRPIRAVFFDMDGTVIDTEPIHMSAFSQALKRMNVKSHDNFLSRCIGLNEVKMRELYLSEIGTTEEFDKICASAWKISLDIKKAEGIKIKKGFTELMTYLSKIHVKSYIVTSTPREAALRDLKIAGVYECFEGFICNGDYKEGKPDPEPYLKALKLSGESASACIAVEDSEMGLYSAVGAGLNTVLVRDMAVIPDSAAEVAFADLDSLKDIIHLLSAREKA